MMMMTGKDFISELLEMVNDFCRTLDAQPPAYSYIPLSTDEERVRVMKSRLYNEVRAAELFGTWLKTTPELEVKAIMAESAHEEMEHAELLSKRITDRGFEPFDYQPLPAQTAMFNAIEGLTDTCQRMAGFSLAGEAVATYLTQKSLQASTVPDWIKQPYRRITQDEEGHSSIPQTILQRYAITGERQESARRAVAMRLVLFREYLNSLDRGAMGVDRW
jgi:1,2-phenylacetyl-CoA epoxidase catalytic subunit